MIEEIRKWKRRIVRTAEAHEDILTGLLLLVAVILILVACFGKTEHKIAAGIYIIL